MKTVLRAAAGALVAIAMGAAFLGFVWGSMYGLTLLAESLFGLSRLEAGGVAFAVFTVVLLGGAGAVAAVSFAARR